MFWNMHKYHEKQIMNAGVDDIGTDAGVDKISTDDPYKALLGAARAI